MNGLTFRSLALAGASFFMTGQVASEAAPLVVAAAPGSFLVPVPALELRAAKSAASKAARVVVGGDDDAKAVLMLDVPFLRRVLGTAPKVLKRASVSLKVLDVDDSINGARLHFHRLLKAPQTSSRASLVAGRDYDSAPLFSVALQNPVPGNRLRSDALTSVLPGMLQKERAGLVLSLEAAPGQPRPQLALAGAGAESERQRPNIEVLLNVAPKPRLFSARVRPRAGVYVNVRGGHLVYGSQPLKLWGVVGFEKGLDRLQKMGFNAQRLWGKPLLYTPESAKRGIPAPVVAGTVDRFDRYVYEMKRRGMWIMWMGLGVGGDPSDGDNLGRKLAIEWLRDDDSFISGLTPNSSAAERADWDAWKKATTEPGFNDARFSYFDERLQLIRKTTAKNLLNHVNPLTKKRYAEEECIAIHEIANENGFLKWTAEEGFGPMPAYFRDKLRAKWTTHLRAKYGTEAALRAAWSGLDADESLDAGLKLEPLLANREKYARARERDFVGFMTGLVTKFNDDFRAYCRSLAPKGVGVNVVPFSFDTQYRHNTPWHYANAQGDIQNFGIYEFGYGSNLEGNPGTYILDSHTVANKPTVLYEVNSSRPNPYRAEFPMRVAALGAWQGWDAVFWHYWQAPGEEPDEDYLTHPMPYMQQEFYWTAVHHEVDPVMNASMALAGQIFRSSAIPEAPAPIIRHIGREGIFSYDLFNGVEQSKDTFTRGSKISFDPQSDFVERREARAKVSRALTSENGVLWDTPNARLIIDTPSAKVYVGRVSKPYTFKDGLVLSGLNTPWVCWSLVSSDGKPLVGANATARALVSAVFDARNSGFVIDTSKSLSGPNNQFIAILNHGHAPVVVDKIDYTLSFPNTLDYTFTGYDYALRPGLVARKSSNVLRVSDAQIWMGVLDISKRGAPAKAVVAPNTMPREAATSPAVAASRGPDRLAGVPHPLPRLSWGDSYERAHRLLRDGSFLSGGVSPEDTTGAVNRSITISRTALIVGTPANIKVVFANKRMTRVEAEFIRVPVFVQALANLEKQFGAAQSKKITSTVAEESRARWLLKGDAADLEITFSLLQNNSSIVYELKPKAAN